jgi:pimeloyl-ACP methyl ester carboxylesterase
MFNGHELAVVIREVGGKRVVIFCHGFGGSRDGPSGGLFIEVARLLAEAGVSSVRFDQYGSGASAGRFEESSFADWVATTRAIADHYLQQDYRVALLGHSMGGSAAIAAAAADDRLAGLAAWVPDPVTNAPTAEPDDVMEEGDKRVRCRYWHEAHAADVATALSRINVPTYIVLAAADAYVSPDDQRRILRTAAPHRRIEQLVGYAHSDWTREQAEPVVAATTAVLVQATS